MIYDHWSKYPAGNWRWPDFSPEEMACRGTGKLMVDDASMDALQALRTEIGRPFTIHSAYRSPEHNRRVGGAKASQHLRARAFDVSMANHDPAGFISLAKRHGFRAIGTYPGSNFVHIDTRPTPAAWGKPFPTRAHRFEQAPVVVERETQKRTADGAAGGAVTGGLVIAATDAIVTGGETLDRLGGLPVAVQVAAIAALAGLAALWIWRRNPKGRG